MGKAVIFGQEEVKALKAAFNLNDVAKILTGTDDPTSVAKDAPRSSIYLRNTGAAGELYQKDDDGSSTNWTIVGGGGAADGGSRLTSMLRGEDVAANKSIFLWEKNHYTVTSSNKFIDFDEGGGELTAQITEGTYLMDTDDNIAELELEIKTRLDAAGADTYTVTFDQETRKWTIASSGTFSLDWATGTNTANSAKTILGFDNSDDATAATHTSDNAIDDQLSSSTFVFQTDSDFVQKSRAVWGIDTAGGAKYSSATIKTLEEISGLSGLAIGDLYTGPASITITASSNDSLDFNDGVDRAATLDAATYLWPYDGLLDNIVTKMDALSAINFTATYDRDSDKITIAGDSAFILEFSSGPNVATSVNTTIGFAVADTASATSHEADNTLSLRGRYVAATDSTIESRLSGVALSDTKLFTKRSENDDYLNIIANPNMWAADPSNFAFDAGSEILMHDYDENSNGEAIVVYMDTVTGNAKYKARYKLYAGGPWLQSDLDVFVNDDSTGNNQGEDFGTADYNEKSFVRIDENGKGFTILSRGITAESDTHGLDVYYTNDSGATWTQATKSSGSFPVSTSDTNNLYCHGAAVREAKGFFAYSKSDNSVTSILHSSDSGSGYVTWTEVAVSGTVTMDADQTANCNIQFFSAETGIDKHRLILSCKDDTGTRVKVWYGKADATSAALIDVNGISTELIAVGQDQLGLKNRLVWIIKDGSDNTKIYQADSNEIYNAGTLTIDAHSNKDFGDAANGGTDKNLDHNNGHTSDVDQGFIWNMGRKIIVLDKRIIGCLGFDAYNGANTSIAMVEAADVTSGNNMVWTAVGHTSGTSGDLLCLYIPSLQDGVLVWKRTTNALSSGNLTEGKIYYRFLTIEDDSVSPLDIEEIDGGQPNSGFQGFLVGKASVNAVTVMWEKFDSGDSYDHLWTNRFI